MKKKLFFRQWYLLLVVAVLLFSCRADLQENLTRSDAQRNVSRISFSQFQKEIRRQDVNQYLVVSALKEAHTHSAHKDGEAPSIAAFRMDTARVQRLEMNGETAYTMAAYNYMDPSEQLYNIIYFYRDGELHYTIHEIRENNTSVPVYDSRIPNQVIVGNPQASLCVEPYQSLDWACKNSEPENQCDKCINCFRVVTHYTYGDCGGGGGGYGSGNPDPDLPGNGPYTGGTGNGGSGGLNDPSHYFFDPLQDPTDPFQVRSMRAKLFWAHLEYEDKQWTNEHPAKYMAILEHYLDNYIYPGNEPNEAHHQWLIQILRNNPNYEWQYFYNQFLAMPYGVEHQNNMTKLSPEELNNLITINNEISNSPYTEEYIKETNEAFAAFGAYADIENMSDAQMELALSKCCPSIIIVPQAMIQQKAKLISANYQFNRKFYPEWSKSKCFWEASREAIQLLLDLGGLVPVIGEVCDITNGVIYTIQGDGLNASLSYASAIPVAGWFSAGTKLGVKVVNKTASHIASRQVLKWIVGTDGLIKFGYPNQLRKVLQLTDAAKQAHHIIPWAYNIQIHSVVQKAAKSTNAFHLNEALNGIAVASWRNQPNHNLYNNRIFNKLEQYNQLNPNATPDQCYSKLMEIINQAKQAIINNPNSHLNDLVF